MKKLWIAGFVVGSVVIGCAGSTGGVGGSGTSSGGSGTGTANDESKTDGGVGGAGCSAPEIAGSRACVPKNAKANAPLTIEIEGEGCLACGATVGACDVAVDGQKITLTLRANQCAAPTEGCSKECRVAKTTCTVPALAKGNYRLELGTGVRVSTDEPRMLIVGAGTDASCTLPNGPPPPITPTQFPRQCTTGNDAECAMVIEGDVCQPCACPTAAISSSAKPDYEAEINARRAACEAGGSPSCAPCPITYEAKCVSGTCTAVMK